MKIHVRLSWNEKDIRQSDRRQTFSARIVTRSSPQHQVFNHDSSSISRLQEPVKRLTSGQSFLPKVLAVSGVGQCCNSEVDTPHGMNLAWICSESFRYADSTHFCRYRADDHRSNELAKSEEMVCLMFLSVRRCPRASQTS